jgi:hypothetical protein
METAILVSRPRHFASPEGYRLFYRLGLSPRCIHCGLVQTIRKDLPIQTKTRTCEARGCTRSRWQNVGKYCDGHYLDLWNIYHTTFGFRGTQGLYEVPQRLVNQAPSILHGLAHQAFPLWSSESKEVIQALLDSSPDAPNIYSLDTEFRYATHSGGHRITEVALVDVKTGQLVVHAVFDPVRAFEASKKLELLQAQPKGQQSSSAEHVQQVHTVGDMVQQLKNCHFRPADKFVEYSVGRQRLLDLNNVCRLLDQSGYKSQKLIPAVSGYTFLPAAKQFLQRILELDSWSLPFLFRILFPRDPLVDQNHSAAVDAIQLAQIIRLLAELSKPVKERYLPESLLQGLEDLQSWNKKLGNINTLDRYFGSVSGTSSRVTVKTKSRYLNWDGNNEQFESEEGIGQEGRINLDEDEAGIDSDEKAGIDSD